MIQLAEPPVGLTDFSKQHIWNLAHGVQLARPHEGFISLNHNSDNFKIESYYIMLMDTGGFDLE